MQHYYLSQTLGAESCYSISKVKDLALVKRNAGISKLVRKCGALQSPEITFYLT